MHTHTHTHALCNHFPQKRKLIRLFFVYEIMSDPSVDFLKNPDFCHIWDHSKLGWIRTVHFGLNTENYLFFFFFFLRRTLLIMNEDTGETRLSRPDWRRLPEVFIMYRLCMFFVTNAVEQIVSPYLAL